ncbi:MAG TPA: hypothetical protein O0X27_01165 [Methanocorpusculum sp.]|nr:hypothetical protein [Methanocorpusculum sp.]
MQSSRMRKGIFIVLAAVVVLTVASAGCFDNIEFLPNEVQNRGSIIAVDSAYIGSSTVVDLLLTPTKYQEELFTALDNYLPKDKPVVDLEAGIGVAMANISKELNVPKETVTLTSNPYMIPLLAKTIEWNKIVTDLRYEVVSYIVSPGETVPVVVRKNLDATDVMNSDTEETVDVSATTVGTIISKAGFTDSKNVTLVIEDANLLDRVLEREPTIKNNVSIIIAVTSASGLELSQMLNKALRNGYTPEMVGDPGSNNCRALVFRRIE